MGRMTPVTRPESEPMDDPRLSPHWDPSPIVQSVLLRLHGARLRIRSEAIRLRSRELRQKASIRPKRWPGGPLRQSLAYAIPCAPIKATYEHTCIELPETRSVLLCAHIKL